MIIKVKKRYIEIEIHRDVRIDTNDKNKQICISKDSVIEILKEAVNQVNILFNESNNHNTNL